MPTPSVRADRTCTMTEIGVFKCARATRKKCSVFASVAVGSGKNRVAACLQTAVDRAGWRGVGGPARGRWAFLMGRGCALGGPEPIASMTSRAHRSWDSPQTYWLVFPLSLPFRSTPRRVDDRLIPMLGCDPSPLPNSRTTRAHTAPDRADPQHRKLITHAHRRIGDAVA